MIEVLSILCGVAAIVVAVFAFFAAFIWGASMALNSAGPRGVFAGIGIMAATIWVPVSLYATLAVFA